MPPMQPTVTSTPTRAAAVQDMGFGVNWEYGIGRGDLVSPVSGHAALVAYERMALTDETVGAMMWLIESTIAQINWKHAAQNDGKAAPDDPEAKKWSDFADTLLTDMTDSWADHIGEAVTMVYMGHAPCEITLKQRDGVNSAFNDKYYGIENLDLMAQSTITRWLYSDFPRNRDLIGLHQSASNGSATIPIWKICNYRVRGALRRPQGMSMLTNAYRAWKLKNRIQDSEAIGIDRDLCGLPVFRLPEEDINKAYETNSDGSPTADAMAAIAKITAAQTAVKNMRFNEAGGLILPSDTFADETAGDKTPKYGFNIITSAGQRSIDTRTAVRDYDRSIARVILMQFLHLGDRSGGSNALSDDQSSLAINSLTYLADKIAQTFTRSALKLVWTINGLPMQYFPKLSHDGITKDSIAAIGQFLRGLGSMQWMLENDPAARVQTLALAGISTDTEGQAYTPPPPPPTPTFLAPGDPKAPVPAQDNQP